MTDKRENDIEPCEQCGSPVKIAVKRTSVRAITDAVPQYVHYRRCTNTNCVSNAPRWVRSIADKV